MQDSRYTHGGTPRWYIGCASSRESQVPIQFDSPDLVVHSLVIRLLVVFCIYSVLSTVTKLRKQFTFALRNMGWVINAIIRGARKNWSPIEHSLLTLHTVFIFLLCRFTATNVWLSRADLKILTTGFFANKLGICRSFTVLALTRTWNEEPIISFLREQFKIVAKPFISVVKYIENVFCIFFASLLQSNF